MKKQQQEDNDEWLIGREREKETRQKQARNQEGEGDGKKVKSRTSRNDSQEKGLKKKPANPGERKENRHHPATTNI